MEDEEGYQTHSGEIAEASDDIDIYDCMQKRQSALEYALRIDPAPKDAAAMVAAAKVIESYILTGE